MSIHRLLPATEAGDLRNYYRMAQDMEVRPAVILGDPTSVFVSQMAAHFRDRGLDSVLVTHGEGAQSALPDRTPIVRSRSYETQAARVARRCVVSPLLSILDRTAPLFRQRFHRVTGVEDSELWLPYVANYAPSAWADSRAALAQRPRVALGHEVTTYGLSTALCRGVPRVLVPWGGDVFTYAESSPFQFALTKLSLMLVDLVVSTSATAARHIVQRFDIPSERVRPLSWGVDTALFRRAGNEQRQQILEKWGIPPYARIFLNARRFRPAWGSRVVLEGFMRFATEDPTAHFILFGGMATKKFMDPARVKLDEAGLGSRFTLLDEQVPLEVYAELMSIADVFLSLLGRSDMRSSSVLQGAQSGGVPIVSDLPEYREIEQLGFAALYVRPESAQDVLEAMRFCVQNPDFVADVRARNEVYIRTHEDEARQMDRLVDMIEDLCRARNKGR